MRYLPKLRVYESIEVEDDDVEDRKRERERDARTDKWGKRRPRRRLKNRASAGSTNRKISYRPNTPVNHRRVNAAHTFSDSCPVPLPRQLPSLRLGHFLFARSPRVSSFPLSAFLRRAPSFWRFTTALSRSPLLFSFEKNLSERTRSRFWETKWI